MRTALVITAVVQSLLALCAQAVTLPFERGYVEPFYAPKTEIVWAATNRLPAKVRIFRVVPANVSSHVVSNLTALGGSLDAKRGWMNLYKPTDARLPLEKVPDKARAYELGTNLLAKLEIPAGELLSEGAKPVATYSPGMRGHYDKATGKMVREPSSMGIGFRRLLDGLECFGQQVRVQFESREVVTQLEVRWHGVQPEKTCAVASPDQILSWIKEGRARAHSMETTGQRWIRVADIRKVTVRNTELRYEVGEGQTSGKLYPFAAVETEIEFKPGDSETLWISCPVIEEALSKPVREIAEFNILPKSFYAQEARATGNE